MRIRFPSPAPPAGPFWARLAALRLTLQPVLQQEGAELASMVTRRGARGTTYRVMWRTSDGKQRSRSVADRVEARRLLAEMTLAERERRGPDPARGRITFRDWSERIIASKTLKPKTRATYEELLESRILPGFGSMPLRDISRSDVRDWISTMAEEVSARRTRNAYALLSHLLSEAVAEGLIPSHPAERLSLPTPETREIQPWTADELRAVARAAGRHGSLILWLGIMGTRWAETIGLRWSDIQGNIVSVSSTLSEARGRFHRVPTKTYTHRKLPVPGALLAILPEQRCDLVFPSPRGKPMRSGQFRDRYFLPACGLAGVRPIRVHDLRHTCASLLDRAGASTTQIQHWLGHQDSRTTQNIYIHAYSGDLAALAGQLAIQASSEANARTSIGATEQF